jgi:hypothetical protein
VFWFGQSFLVVHVPRDRLDTPGKLNRDSERFVNPRRSKPTYINSVSFSCGPLSPIWTEATVTKYRHLGDAVYSEQG